jgi:homoserine kinase
MLNSNLASPLSLSSPEKSFMSRTSSVTVTVPATTANLGPGFDCIGAALTLYNHFKFSRLDRHPRRYDSEQSLEISVSGAEAHRVSTDESNLVYRSFLKLYDCLGHEPPPVAIEIDLGVPLARGLGSSATAIAGGLVAANALAGTPLTRAEIVQLAIEIERHPDNVVPALLGGCRLAAASTFGEHSDLPRMWEICEIPWHPTIVPVVAIPTFELSTEKARGVLPEQYTRADAIFNTSHLGLLVRGLETGNGNWLRAAMQDRIHQPYREMLIPGYQAVRAAAIEAGAYGMAISGAGPTALALASIADAPAVAAAMSLTWKEYDIKAEARSLSLDSRGAMVKYGQ